jgi:tetratricopeptide (TPR) repeat protein
MNDLIRTKQEKGARIIYMAIATVLIVLFFILGGGFIIAQSSASDLSPESKAALKKGLNAAELKEWETAIESFNEALTKGGERSPKVNYFLALALDRAGGRDLHAIARYRAFLALSQDSPKADNIRQQIAFLETRAVKSLRKLANLAERALDELGTTDLNPDNYYCPLIKVKLWLGKKDNKHFTTRELVYNDPHQQKLKCLGSAYARLGDYFEAERIAETLSRGWERTEVFLMIARNKYGSGNTTGALWTLTLAEEYLLMPCPSREESLAKIALLRLRFGDITGAETLLKEADIAFTKVAQKPLPKGIYRITYGPNQNPMNLAIRDFAFTYLSTGAFSEAEVKISQLLERNAIELHDSVLEHMVVKYARRGQLDLAKATKKRIKDSLFYLNSYLDRCTESGCDQPNDEFVDEFADWTEFIGSYLMSNFSEGLRVLLKKGDPLLQYRLRRNAILEREEEPEAYVFFLLSLAEDYVEALLWLSEMETKWQKRRKHSR